MKENIMNIKFYTLFVIHGFLTFSVVNASGNQSTSPSYAINPSTMSPSNKGFFTQLANNLRSNTSVRGQVSSALQVALNDLGDSLQKAGILTSANMKTLSQAINQLQTTGKLTPTTIASLKNMVVQMQNNPQIKNVVSSQQLETLKMLLTRAQSSIMNATNTNT